MHPQLRQMLLCSDNSAEYFMHELMKVYVLLKSNSEYSCMCVSCNLVKQDFTILTNTPRDNLRVLNLPATHVFGMLAGMGRTCKLPTGRPQPELNRAPLHCQTDTRTSWVPSPTQIKFRFHSLLFAHGKSAARSEWNAITIPTSRKDFLTNMNAHWQNFLQAAIPFSVWCSDPDYRWLKRRLWCPLVAK